MKVPKARKLSSGKWFIQLRLGGQSIPVTESTEKKCIRQAELTKAEYLAGKKIVAIQANNITLEKACEEYLKLFRSRWSPTTAERYEKIPKNSFQALMKLPVSKITRRMVDKAVSVECSRNGRGGKPRAPKTIHNEWGFITEVLAYNDNPMPDIRLPEIKRVPVQILTPEQVYGAIQGTPIELPCLLAMWMTLTMSEIRGLTKSKSIRNGQLSVVETVVQVKGKAVRKTGGKEYSRSRTLPIPPYIQKLIDEVPTDIICPLTANAMDKRLRRALEKADLPAISFHKLRHISASTMTALGVPPAYIKAAGGWSTNQIMESVYTHIYTDASKMYASVMDNYMDKIIDNANKNANGT